MIPDPGTDTSAEFRDAEPNDTPATATPVGIITGPVWMGFAMPYTSLQSATDVDYFVFRTGSTVADIYIQACFNTTPASNALDMTLYQVTNGMQGAVVVQGNSTDTSCETLVDFGMGPTVLTADTTYLLEVRPGVGGDLSSPVMYSA